MEVAADAGAGETEPHAGEPRRELTCVLFPGVVRNVDRALQCLGGIRELSRVHSNPTDLRLGLTFSPENLVAKKTYADAVLTPGLLLRVKVRRRRGANASQHVVSTHIVGEVTRIYKFNSLFDFTTLPVQGGSGACAIKEIWPSWNDSTDWIRGEANQFTMPTFMTRADRPLDYRYCDKKYPLTRHNLQPNQLLHQRLRQNRRHYATRVMFDLTNDVPATPQPGAVQELNDRARTTHSLARDTDIVIKLFASRPIWSRNSLQLHARVPFLSLKFILPTVAFYYRSGPWKQLWTRFGYDPRADPDAKRYQTLDFRLGAIAPPNRRRVGLGHKKVARVWQTGSRERRTHRSPFAGTGNVETIAESAVLFRPGEVPSQRHIYYQYCDVLLPEVERLLASSTQTTCHPQRGWLSADQAVSARGAVRAHAKMAQLGRTLPDTGSEDSSGESDDDDERDQHQEEREVDDHQPEEFILPDVIDD